MHGQGITSQAGQEGRSREQGQTQAGLGNVDAFFRRHEDATPIVDRAFDEERYRTNQPNEDNRSFGPHEMAAATAFIPLTVKMGRKEEDTGGNQDGTGQGNALPGQPKLQQQGEKGSASKVPQRPHGLHSRHEALADFPFNEDAVDVDDDIEQPQGGTEENCHQQRRSVSRHIAENVQDDGNGQAGSSQRAAAA